MNQEVGKVQKSSVKVAHREETPEPAVSNFHSKIAKI